MYQKGNQESKVNIIPEVPDVFIFNLFTFIPAANINNNPFSSILLLS